MNRAAQTVLWLTVVAVIAALPGPAAAEQLVYKPDPNNPQTWVDSGWDANFNAAAVDIVVDQVNLARGFVVLEISKDFTQPPVQYVFPPITIDFVQRLGDPQTVGRIIIEDESITNLTGETWTDFHWRLEGQAVSFNVAASGTFGLDPFETQQWLMLGGEPNAAYALQVLDGAVLPAPLSPSSFFPGSDGSDLVMDVNLLESEDLVTFRLLEIPTSDYVPEPATLGLLGLGLGALAARKRGRVSAALRSRPGRTRK